MNALVIIILWIFKCEILKIQFSYWKHTRVYFFLVYLRWPTFTNCPHFIYVRHFLAKQNKITQFLPCLYCPYTPRVLTNTTRRPRNGNFMLKMLFFLTVYISSGKSLWLEPFTGENQITAFTYVRKKNSSNEYAKIIGFFGITISL